MANSVAMERNTTMSLDTFQSHLSKSPTSRNLTSRNLTSHSILQRVERIILAVLLNMVITLTATTLTRPTKSPISLIIVYQFVDILHQVIILITHLHTILPHTTGHLTGALLRVYLEDRIDGNLVLAMRNILADQINIDQSSIIAPTWMTNLTMVHQKMCQFTTTHITKRGLQITCHLLHRILTVLHDPHIIMKTALRLHRRIMNVHLHHHPHLRKNKGS
jgi:hypothetical protein